MKYAIMGDNSSRRSISLLCGMGIASCVLWMIFKFNPINDGKTFIFSPPELLFSALDIYGFSLAGLLLGVAICVRKRAIRLYVGACVTLIFLISLASLWNSFPFLKATEVINLTSKINYDITIPAMLCLLIIFAVWYFFHVDKPLTSFGSTDMLVACVAGAIYMSGLIISGMVKGEKILGFWTFSFEKWDPSLAIVIASAVILNFISFQFIWKEDKQVLKRKMDNSGKKVKDIELVEEASIFGLGWGLDGICLGPAYVMVLLLSLLFAGKLILSFVVG